MIDFNKAAPLSSFEDAEMRKERVGQALRANAKRLVQYLYPQAEFQGDQYRIGNVNGDSGKSMSVCVVGEAAGNFYDHADTTQKGDIFDLWAGAHGINRHGNFAQILTECDEWLNGKPPQHAEIRHQQEIKKPKPPKTLEREVDSFPYLSTSGDVLFEAVRFEQYTMDGEPILKDGKPQKSYRPRQPNGQYGYPSGPRPLYRLPDIDSAQEVVFCEGEKCADAVHMLGYAGTSAPGGSNTKIDKIDWRPLAGKSVVLWPDNDDTGFKFMEDVSEKLNSIGCQVRTVSIPHGVPKKWDAADADAELVHDLLSSEKKPKEHILYEQWSDIEYVYQPELVDDLLPQVGVATLYGESTVGKTFVVLDWIETIASGKSLFGRETEPVGALYLAFEGFHGLKKRIHGIKQHRGKNNIAFELVDAPWTLSDPEDQKAFYSFIESAQRRFDETGFGLGVIVIDTLTDAFAGMDSNSQAEVSKAMKILKRLAMELNCLIVVVGHTGKDTTRGMAGSFVYKSNSDVFIELRAEKDEDDLVLSRCVFVDKVKDGPSGYVLSHYELQEIEIGKKPNGKNITTCVVDWYKASKSNPIDSIPHAEAVLLLLRQHSQTTNDIAMAIGKERSVIQKILTKMQKIGEIYCVKDGKVNIWHLGSQSVHT